MVLRAAPTGVSFQIYITVSLFQSVVGQGRRVPVHDQLENDHALCMLSCHGCNDNDASCSCNADSVRIKDDVMCVRRSEVDLKELVVRCG